VKLWLFASSAIWEALVRSVREVDQRLLAEVELGLVFLMMKNETWWAIEIIISERIGMWTASDVWRGGKNSVAISDGL
jgi:hypothetical protein